MQKLTHTEHTIKKFAGVLGLIQGGSWMVLSILCIILYIKEIENISVHTYMDEAVLYIYTIFLINDRSHIDGQITTASVFAGFMWTYLILDLIWVLASLNILAKKEYRAKNSLQLWSLATSLVCLLDLILVILLGIDYQNCFDKASRALSVQLQLNSEQLCASVILPVLTIAAKGFTLWIVNLIFAIAIFKISRQQSNNVQQLRSENSQSHTISLRQPYFQVEYSPYSPTFPHSPQRQAYNKYPNMQRRSQIEQPYALRSPPRRF